MDRDGDGVVRDAGARRSRLPPRRTPRPRPRRSGATRWRCRSRPRRSARTRRSVREMSTSIVTSRLRLVELLRGLGRERPDRARAVGDDLRPPRARRRCRRSRRQPAPPQQSPPARPIPRRFLSSRLPFHSPAPSTTTREPHRMVRIVLAAVKWKRCSGSRGRRPRAPCASTVPPACVTTCLTIARPSPVPRDARAWSER